MIVSVSRRTDVPGFYWDWFLHRLRAGYAMTRNPMNANQIKRVELNECDVDGFVFWTKNPLSMLEKGLDQIEPYPYYIQLTITGYGPDVEPFLPPKSQLIQAVKQLSARIGPKRILWRYDPILFSPVHTMDWHEHKFAEMSRALSAHVDGCTISFLDEYKKIARALAEMHARRPDEAERIELARRCLSIAKGENLALSGCVDEGLGLAPGPCVDHVRLSLIAGYEIAAQRDRSQRGGCACAKSVDIGAYHCCPHGCRYCYANISMEAVARNAGRHTPHGAFLID